MPAPPAPEPLKMTVSILILSNLNDRLEWLRHRLNFLYKIGHQGETLVGIWGGHDKLDDLRAFAAALSPLITILAQDGARLPTVRLVELAERATGDYIITQGDDDFLLPMAFPACIALLADPGVFCAQGRVLGIDAAVTLPIGVGGFPTWQAPEAEVLPRFCAFTRHIGTTYHAMYRRPQFIARAKAMDDVMQRTHNRVFFESMGEFFSVISGRFVVCNQIYFVKGFHHEHTSALWRASQSERMSPYLVLSDYKILEGWVFRLLEDQGVDLSVDATRKQVMDAMLDYLGWVMFKRRDMIEPAETDIKNWLRQSPTPPEIQTLVNVIASTKA
jgi:hypothetical protein